MTDAITYEDMEHFLVEELHFQAHHVTESRTVFDKPGMDIMIVLNPWFKILPQQHVAYLRHTLTQNDILSAQQFTERLRVFQSSKKTAPVSEQNDYKSNGRPSSSIHMDNVPAG